MFTPSDVNLKRVLRQLDALAQIGRQATGGVTRYTFSAAHLEATHQVADWMAAADLDVRFDRWGNLLGRTDHPGSMVLSGSHLDSVPNGGHYDGVLGVVAALEAVTLILEQRIPFKRPLGVVSFIEEEGARFRGLLGSKLATGNMSDAEIEALQDANGEKFLDVLNGVQWRYPVSDPEFQTAVDTFLELHIEQGKLLERAGVPVGVVTSIAGPTFMEVVFTGQADHAGATAYEDRRDSLLAAADFITSLREMGLQRFAGRGHMTVGKIQVKPNVTNVVAGETLFHVDFRSADPAAADEMTTSVYQLLQVIADRHPIEYRAQIRQQTPPVIVAETIRQALVMGAEAASVPHMPIVSWAAHDAMNMAAVAKAGMMFVPCRDGRSHTPEEYVNPENIAVGIAVLANALIQLAQ